jgi:hypothetical protein
MEGDGFGSVMPHDVLAPMLALRRRWHIGPFLLICDAMWTFLLSQSVCSICLREGCMQDPLLTLRGTFVMGVNIVHFKTEGSEIQKSRSVQGHPAREVLGF